MGGRWGATACCKAAVLLSHGSPPARLHVSRPLHSLAHRHNSNRTLPASPHCPCSRSSVWQWLRYGATLDDGQPLSVDRVNLVIQEELDALRGQVGGC